VRATVVELDAEGPVALLRHESFRLTHTSGVAEDLFGPLARFVGDVLEPDGQYALGFIFAFPLHQDGVASGRLAKWTKEFEFEGVVGRDVVRLLDEAIATESESQPMLRSLTVSALANDTVAVLASGAYLDRRCDIGLVVATGTNMAVALDRSLVPRLLPPVAGGPDEMMFNMESGNFEGVRGIQTRYDRMLDDQSGTEGQLLEKMVSGRYLGELVRLVVADLSSSPASNRERFSDGTRTASALRVPYGFTTEYLSDVAYDSSRGLAGTGMLLRRLGVPASTLSERRLLRRICRLVADRSARLVAMGIAATALYIDPDLEATHVVAADGSLFRLAPHYQEQVERGLREILGSRGANRVQLSYLRDAPGIGAAIIAAVAAGG
jgi:hexokinase